MRVIVTGGAGFIGSTVCRYFIDTTSWSVVNLDKLTYAANPDSLHCIAGNQRYKFIRGDIADALAVRRLFDDVRPHALINLAAESHVDRSIDSAEEFIHTNINGTYTLLEEARRYIGTLQGEERQAFRFLQVSTDEVFGSLGDSGRFCEASPYNPSSPYAASKAASDHLVRSWGRTYDLPVLIAHCSNNYGPYQFPEKLIPLMILRALAGQTLPVYGAGDNVRDWLYVEDTATALKAVLEEAAPGATYLVGGSSERRNLDVATEICDVIDELVGLDRSGPRRQLIRFVEDRPGHDSRYASNTTKMRTDLNWKPRTSFNDGLRQTVNWYLKNENWWRSLMTRNDTLSRQGLGHNQIPQPAT
jgi:dTDP-glucose 4,6-dehydratase